MFRLEEDFQHVSDKNKELKQELSALQRRQREEADKHKRRISELQGDLLNKNDDMVTRISDLDEKLRESQNNEQDTLNRLDRLVSMLQFRFNCMLVRLRLVLTVC